MKIAKFIIWASICGTGEIALKISPKPVKSIIRIGLLGAANIFLR